ncbi:efflux RND transporter permease subunit [Microbacterium gubbeenense]|uniref:efflux RND transporter permease subunit n=1 Tax=Microbacterium gubbeenense TaxID=159896 RepID=UPI0004236812|nr:efflux RND transporter permease subunit [Microbacterium gubbeenense]
MSKLSVLSLKNRALIALITICVAIVGGVSLTSLKQELIPTMELPALIVSTTYPGASPEVVEEDVSTPIEEAIQAVPGLDSTSATSSSNVSMVQAMFDYGTDMATAEQKMQQAISRISSQLPESVDPQVVAISLDDLPVIQVAVSGFDDPATAKDDLENIVLPEVEDVEGVGSASVAGAAGQRITITPVPGNLQKAGVTQQAISDALEQNGNLFPGGDITEDGETLTVQTGVKLTSVDDIRELPLISNAQPEVNPETGEVTQPETFTIADVAQVEVEDDPIASISRVNGEDAISISVTKLPDGNTVDVSEGVLAALDDAQQQLSGVEFTVVFDQAPFITQSIETLAVEGLLGLVFAVVVILVFLMSIRSTLVTAISIPTSVLVTFASMQAFGYSLNMLTLGALTISIGRVVDDSIVVIENIKRHYVEGSDKGDSIRLAVREVAGAITASTITTVAVFLPIVFVGDMVGELFRPFAMTVTIAMLASLLVALTIVPVLAYWFMKPGKPLVTESGQSIDPEHPDAPKTRLQKAYQPILAWTLKHSWSTLGIAVVVLIATITLAPLMKVNFLGDTGQNSLTVTQDLGETASLEAQDEAAGEVEGLLAGVDGVENVQVTIGSASGGGIASLMAGSGITFSVMTDPDVDQGQIQADLEDAVAGLEDVGDITVQAAAGMGMSSDITVNVEGANDDDVRSATEALMTSLDGRDGIKAPTNNLEAEMPYIAVDVDRQKAAEAGLSEAAVGAMVNGAMQPSDSGSVELDGTSTTVYIASDDPPATANELRAMEIPTAAGVVELQDIATVEQSSSPASITTQNGMRTATITITPASDNLAEATASVQAAVDDTELPDGTRASIGGVAEDQAASFEQLGLAMLAAILIIYIVMVATFKSLRQPLLLLISVPFAATGAILLQVITGVPLGVASLIGVLMLIGIVVTNAIVLVDLVNQYRSHHGLNAHDATMAGSSMRLRPILMTALATIFALIPMALGITGHSGFISQPLAIVVIGGLVSSTFMTLIVLPTLYNLVEGAKERREKRRGGAPTDPSDGPGDAQDAAHALPGEVTPDPAPESARTTGSTAVVAHEAHQVVPVRYDADPTTSAQTVVDVHQPGAPKGSAPIVTVRVQMPEQSPGIPTAPPLRRRRG